MALKRGLFGSIKIVLCDRCGEQAKPTYVLAALCDTCFSIEPETLREEAFNESGWEVYLGKTAKRLRCAICGSTAPPDSFKHVCIRCRTSHLDSTHGSSWGYEPHSEVEVDHCYRCEGLVVKRRIANDRTERVYYVVGSKTGSTHSYACQGESTPAQETCEHDFLQVYSNARSREEAIRIEIDLKSQPVAMQFMASDMAGLEHNLMYATEGSTHFWCWKCGYYLNLNPSRYGLLPQTGKSSISQLKK